MKPWYRRGLPGWFSFGGGGGLSSVTTNATLTGTGQVASPLGVNGWPLTFYTTYGNNDNVSQTLGAANRVMVFGFALPYSLLFSNILVHVTAADAVNLYDVGLYDVTGTLKAHVGAQSLPATGKPTFGVVGAPIRLAAGLYAFGFTGNAVTATLGCDGGPAITWISNTNVATSAGGALPASIGALTTTPGSFPIAFALF